VFVQETNKVPFDLNHSAALGIGASLKFRNDFLNAIGIHTMELAIRYSLRKFYHSFKRPQ
jgi:hypothetical protein